LHDGDQRILCSSAERNAAVTEKTMRKMILFQTSHIAGAYGCWLRSASGALALLLVGMTGLASAQAADAVRATGLRPPTVEDRAWMDLNLASTQRVLPNALGLERINRQRRTKGLAELKAEAVPVGAESQSTNPAALPGGMDIPGTADAKGVPVAATLPAAVDNSTLPSFPPVRSQGSLGSCAAFSTTYYAGTHMLGLARGWNNKDDDDNGRKLSPKWTYNFANDGADAGAWFSTIMDVLLKLGCPAWSEFPYVGVGTTASNYLEWSRDAAVWRSAAANRFQQIGRVQAVDTAAGLANAKALLANGYALLYATHVSSWQFMPISDDPATTADNSLAGRPGCWKVSALANSGHAMTLVGYNDDLWMDLNKNGTVDAGEKGALKVVNSWGTSSWWEAGTDGYGWIAYDALKASSAVGGVSSADRQRAFWNSEIYWITARASYTPTLLGQFTVSTAIRNQLGLKVGASATSTTTPQSTFPSTTVFGWANDSDTWPQALDSLGGAYGFAGTSAAVGGTFVLDLTDLAQAGPRRYYVAVQDNRPGTAATLSDFRLMTAGGTVLATATAGLPGTADNSTVRAYADFATTGAPVISSAGTATATVGQTFSYTITASNSPTSFGANSLPPGLVVNPTSGAITGTPTVAGPSYIVGISAANAGGVGTGTLTLTITTPLIATPRLTSASTAAGTVGRSFSFTVTASNSPTSFGASGLPPGLALNPSSGAISGTPTLAGSYTAALSAANAGGAGTGALTITIDSASGLAPVITSSTTATGVRSSAFIYRIEASNSPASFAALGLPSSLTLDDVTGYITGTLPATGSYPITLSASNAAGTGYQVLQLTVTGSSIYGPPNDAFANRIPLSGSAANTTGTNVSASAETGEPDHGAGMPASRSVWWTWTAPTSGLATLDTIGSDVDTLLAVYTGTTVDGLSLTASDDDSGGGTTSQVSFSAVAGTIYQIAVDGRDSAEGQIALALRQSAGAGPANDAFANRIALSGALAVGSGANLSATAEVGEPAHAGDPATCSVWWTWTAPAAGRVTVDTIGSDFDTLLAVYTGSALTALTAVAADDQSGGGNTSLASFPATAGVTYQIAVDGWHGQTGGVQLHLELQGAAAANDHFANRITVTGATVTAAGSNLNATAEANEPAHAGYAARRSVWWTWTAPGTGVARFNTEGSAFDTLLAVYTGTALAGLVQVAADDDGGAGTTSSLTFYASAGATYQIAVDGYAGASGSIALLGALSTGSSNDHFANRIALTGSHSADSGGNVSATAEAGEPDHSTYSPAKSVWWTWTAPANGMVTLSTAGSSFDTVLAVYQGSSLASLIPVVANDDAALDLSSQVLFFAATGAVYQIAVDGYGGAEGSIELGLGQNPSSVLYSTDFEAFPTGLGALDGFDGWLGTDDPTLGTYGVYAAGSQEAWVGFNYTAAEGVYVYRPVNYNPLVADTPVVTFSVDLAIYDSSLPAYDLFGFFLFNANGDYLAQILFDTWDFSVWVGSGGGLTEVGSFTSNTPLHLDAKMDFASNRWSASLDGSVLFTDRILHAGTSALSLGEVAAGWQVGTVGNPGDNFMTFDNYRLAVDTAPTITTPSPLPPGQVGTPYDLLLAAGGGSEPYTWEIITGSLPHGLSLGGDGAIGGTPDETITAAFTVQVTGSNGMSASGSFSLTVSADIAVREFPAGCATAGSPLAVTVTIDLSTTSGVTSLALTEVLPAAWQFLSVESDQAPDLQPALGDTGTLEFSWIVIPDFPLTLTYHVAVPALASAGLHCVTGTSAYRTDGPELTATVRGETCVEVGGCCVPHQADQDGDWVIDLSPELTRLIQFYNLSGYRCQAGTEDGYAPGTGNRTCTPHQADQNGDWQIQLSPELTRLIQFYNSGGYHCADDTEDGYAPDLGGAKGADKPGTLTASRTLAYPGASDRLVEVSLTLQHSQPGALTSLLVQESVPPGWQFVELGGSQAPALSPQPGAAGTLAFAWIALPATWPVTLTYRLARVALAKDEQSLGGQVGFRQAGGEILVDLPKTAFAPPAPVAPTGEFRGGVDAAAASAGRGLWDLTGSYTLIVDHNLLSMNIIHSADGKLTGAATYPVSPETLVSLPVRGTVTGTADGLLARLTLAGSAANRTVAVGMALTLTLDPVGLRLVGPLSGSLSRGLDTVALQERVTLALPAPMDGTWNLRFQLTQAGRAVDGTALLTLANGVEHTLVTHGRTTGQGVILTLSGAPTDPTARALRMRTTITPLADGWARLESLSATAYGQSLLWP
jgi:C1A family cysteine protease